MTTSELVRVEKNRSVNVRGQLSSGPFLATMIVALVVLQRFAISPGGFEVPIVMPVMFLFLAFGHLRGYLVIDRRQARLILVLCVTAAVCSIAQLAVDAMPSVLSLGLLLVLYLPAMFRSTGGTESSAVVARVFVITMTIAAIVSLAQFGLQYVGVANNDVFATIVPDAFQVHGFSPNAPIYYGQDLRRSNGVLFLEPSFLSLFLGFAVLVALRAGAGWLQLTILLAGMLPTLAGNGLVILLPGLLVFLFSPLRRNLVSLLPGVLAAIVAAAATPLGQLYLNRSTEASSDGSSSSFRFVQPYSVLLPASLDSPFHALFGHGAGNSDAYLDGTALFGVTRPAIPKVFFEYGVLGGIGILGVLIVILFFALRDRGWMGGLLIGFFIVNASLLQAELVFFTIFWLILLPSPAERQRWSPRRAVAPPHPVEMRLI